ncbi:recombinase family protein [Nocardia sp. alder85J]|uniref:recombinase family protein n=1 Tax=Nocardia sp. alder85J TaxID=2862949 RepID=UPI001CD37B14|nr:recombinase family protein [Nocardia sp. alder85J]MCX4096544.1 recombinase family protein [Nocardia sp. alder85J]
MSRAYGWQRDGRTVDPVEADEIRLWARYMLADVDPAPSQRGLVDELSARGVTTVSGKPWRAIVIRRALTAPRMIGMKFDDTGRLVDADMEPILDWETWQRLRAVLDDPQRSVKFAPNRNRPPALLSGGLARCGADGSALHHSGGRHGSYACSVRAGGCGLSIAAPLLEADATRRLLARLTDPAGRQSLGRGQPAEAEALAELDELQARLRTLGEDYADGAIERDTMLSGTERAREHILRARKRAERARLLTALPDASTENSPPLDGWWNTATDADRHTVLAAVLDHVIVRPSEGRTVIGADRLEYHWYE